MTPDDPPMWMQERAHRIAIDTPGTRETRERIYRQCIELAKEAGREVAVYFAANERGDTRRHFICLCPDCAPPTAPAVAAEPSDRARFEAHAKSQGYSIDPDTRPGRDGGYWSSHTQLMWESWNAALRQGTAAPASVPAVNEPSDERVTYLNTQTLRALRRLESAVDWHLGRSGFTQTVHLKGLAHSESVRKELYAAHEDAQGVLRITARSGAPTDPKASALEKDAARYRWLRGNFVDVLLATRNGNPVKIRGEGELWDEDDAVKLDTAVDAAIASTSGESGHD